MNEFHRAWRDLTPTQKAVVVAGATTQFALLGAALCDLARRPAAQVRGPKPMWVGLSFVNFLGPIAYFALGRKKR